MNTEIKNINFTEKDFELLVESLEHLPDKGFAGELMFDLLTSSLLKDDPEAEAKMKSERAKKEFEKKRKKEELKEEVRILQSKLIQLKRHMISNGLINKVHEIIN